MMEPLDLPPTPNAAGGLWLLDDITNTLTPIAADDAPVSPPSDDE